MTNKGRQITDQELANYVVCPQAWYLKISQLQSLPIHSNSEHAIKSRKVRKEWGKKNTVIYELHQYKKSICLLLAGVVALLIALELLGMQSLITGSRKQSDVQIASSLDSSSDKEQDSFSSNQTSTDVPFEIIALLGIIGVAVYLYNGFDRKRGQISAEIGFEEKTLQILTKNGNEQVVPMLCSNVLGILGKPDAIVIEDKKFVPIIFQPFGNKVYDRHVIKLIAYQFMMQESGQDTDYGVLVLGEKQRRVMIRYSEQKKEWLCSLVSEMREVASGKQATPSPSKYKCRNCDVCELCDFKA